MIKKVSAAEKAEYLISKGYYPIDTDINELISLIESKSNIKETKKHINDISTVYIDKTGNP